MTERPHSVIDDAFDSHTLSPEAFTVARAFATVLELMVANGNRPVGARN